jgi:uncharacterized membrane protein YhaH (DUF805 family)
MQMDWMLMPLRRYADFSGRSRRKEYWFYILGLVIVAIACTLAERMLSLPKIVFGVYGPLVALFFLATFVPTLAVAIRRFHDQNRDGWWVLLGYGPQLLSWIAMATGSIGLIGIAGIVGLIGGVIMLVFMFLEGTRGPNRFGPDPKGAEGGMTV